MHICCVNDLFQDGLAVNTKYLGTDLQPHDMNTSICLKYQTLNKSLLYY